MRASTTAETVRAVGLAADNRWRLLKQKLEGQNLRAIQFLAQQDRICRKNSAAECEEAFQVFAATEGAVGAVSTQGNTVRRFGGASNLSMEPLRDGQLARFERDDQGQAVYLIHRAAPSGDHITLIFRSQQIEGLMSGDQRLGKSGEVFLTDAGGKFITPPRYEHRSSMSHPITARPILACLSGKDGETLDLDYRGVPVIHGFKFVKEIGGGCIMAHIDQAEAFAPVVSLQRRFAGLTALFFIIAVAASFGLANRFSRPLGRLLLRIKDVQDEKWESTNTISGPSEIAALGREFEKMAHAVRESQRHLTESVIERTRDLAAANEQLLREIEERRLAEESLRSMVEHSPFAIYRVELMGRFLMVNPAMAEMLGYTIEELLALDPNKIFRDQNCRERVLEYAAGQSTFRGYQGVWMRKDGAEILLRCSGRSVLDKRGNGLCFEVFAENVTEQKKLERQLRFAQKMEVVGQLAGGVAHDFNNLLGIILGHADLIMNSSNPAWNVTQIREAALRGANVAKHLLAFSRKQVMEPTVLDPNVFVPEFVAMVKHLIGDLITIEIVSAPELGRIKADQGQIEQVLLNLALNARDAMNNDGTIRIDAANVNLDESYLRSHANVAPGRYVRLSVSDTGCGIPPGHLQSIFEPFFTTKEPGKGTGLGLAMVYGIMRQSGGHVEVYSEEGKGTRFNLYFPRTDELAIPKGTQSIAETLGGTEVVLVAEDNELLREVACESLTSHGYQVIAAAGPREAIQLAELHRGKIHLLVTDMVMPEMSGRELANRLMSKLPDLRVLFVSGYSREDLDDLGLNGGKTALLQKPVALVDFLQKVRQVLDAREQVQL